MCAVPKMCVLLTVCFAWRLKQALLFAGDHEELSDAFGGPPIIQYKVETRSHSSKLWEMELRDT